MSVQLFSQFEEKFEEINAVEAPPNIPSTSGANENATTTIATESRVNEVGLQEKAIERMSLDVSTSQDFVTGIMKIVPDVDVSPLFKSYSNECSDNKIIKKTRYKL